MLQVRLSAQHMLIYNIPLMHIKKVPVLGLVRPVKLLAQHNLLSNLLRLHTKIQALVLPVKLSVKLRLFCLKCLIDLKIYNREDWGDVAEESRRQ